MNILDIDLTLETMLSTAPAGGESWVINSEKLNRSCRKKENSSNKNMTTNVME